MSKVVSLYRAITALEAMQEAVEHFGGTADVTQVIQWVQKHYAFRGWKASTIRGYFYAYSKPQKFLRVRKGIYSAFNQTQTQKSA